MPPQTELSLRTNSNQFSTSFPNVSIKQQSGKPHTYFPSKSLSCLFPSLLLCSQIACVMPEIPKIFPPIGASIYASAEGRDEDEERARFSPTTREREQTACSCRFRMIHSPSPLKKSESGGVRRFTEIYCRNFRAIVTQPVSRLTR